MTVCFGCKIVKNQVVFAGHLCCWPYTNATSCCCKLIVCLTNSRMSPGTAAGTNIVTWHSWALFVILIRVGQRLKFACDGHWPLCWLAPLLCSVCVWCVCVCVGVCVCVRTIHNIHLRVCIIEQYDCFGSQCHCELFSLDLLGGKLS